MTGRSGRLAANRLRRYQTMILVAALCLALALTIVTLAEIQPPGLWLASLRDPDISVAALVFSDIALPRIAMSLLAGGGLAVCSVILQQVLQNPIAEPATVGISGGAYVALAASSLWLPALLTGGQSLVAFAGSLIGAGLVLAIARRQLFSSHAVVVAGLTINLLFGATGAVLTVLNHDYLSSLSIWQSGSLIQNGWASVTFLLPPMLVATLILLALSRPLAMLSLGDELATASGVRTAATRVAGLGLAAAIAAILVSTVGVLGFVGLMASQIARLTGARRFSQRLIRSAAIGALLLWLTDQCVQFLGLRQEISTGAATALTGSLCLLVSLLLKPRSAVPSPGLLSGNRMGRQSFAFPGMSGEMLPHALPAFLLALAFILAVFFGRSPSGWGWLPADMLGQIMPWRLPRVVAAGSAGAMLAVSGVLLQRMTGNPVASPEVLGISSGAALGVILLLLFVSGYSAELAFAASGLGAVLTLLGLLALNLRVDSSPARLLLIGIGLATMLGACSSVLLTSGDPRATILLTWMSGSTYRVSETAAIYGLASAVISFPIACLPSRWLTLMSLGEATARSAGLDLMRSRSIILLIAGLLTGAATIIVGPLTFVGLIAPHMARLSGKRHPHEEVVSAAAIGAVLLVAADWIGRNLVFPWQVPAGLVAAVIGAPAFLWMMRRQA